MDPGLFFMVIGLGLGLGGVYLARRFRPEKKQPPPAPINRQQARKLERETHKRKKPPA